MPILEKTVEVFIGVCLPVLLVVAGGWAAGKKFRLDLDSLVALNIRFFVPAFIFVRVYESPLAGPEALKIVAFTLVLITALGGLVLLLCSVLKPTPGRRNSILLGSIFYNSGNFGIPLVTLAFGAGAQPVQVFVLMTMNISTFTLGTLLAGAPAVGAAGGAGFRSSNSLRHTPSFWHWSVAGSSRGRSRPWHRSGNRSPSSHWAFVPLALVTLGVQLAHTQPPSPRGDLTWVLGLRLVAGRGCAVLATAFGFPPEIRAVLIAGAAAPTPINAALLAHDLGGDSRFASAAVFYSRFSARSRCRSCWRWSSRGGGGASARCLAEDVFDLTDDGLRRGDPGVAVPQRGERCHVQPIGDGGTTVFDERDPVAEVAGVTAVVSTHLFVRRRRRRRAAPQDFRERSGGSCS